MLPSEKLISIVTDDAYNALCQCYRGCVLYIPTKENKTKTYKHLLETIGLKETVHLISSVGGSSFYFRKGAYEDARLRHAEIVERYQGQRVQDFAVEVGYSVQLVWKILKKAGKKTGRISPEEMALRNRQILEDSTTMTVKQLSEKYRLSVGQLWHVLNKARQRAVNQCRRRRR